MCVFNIYLAGTTTMTCLSNVDVLRDGLPAGVSVVVMHLTTRKLQTQCLQDFLRWSKWLWKQYWDVLSGTNPGHNATEAGIDISIIKPHSRPQQFKPCIRLLSGILSPANRNHS